MGLRKLFALLLVPAYVVLIAVLDTLQIQAVFDPPLLLPVMNILFLGIVPVAVAYVAGRVYLTTGTSSILLTGCGMLTFGLCTIPAGWLIGMPGGPNMLVTMHNTGAFVGAFLLALGAILNLVGRMSPDQRATGKQTIAKAYGLVCIFVIIFTFATVKGLVPSFFIQGVGPTLLRQTVLATAIILFVLSSAFAGYTYGQWKSDFLYWYSLGLALIAIGLCAVFLQTAVGSPIGWLGRSAQYIGGVLLLVAILTAARSARDKSLPIERVIANFLADAEASYRDLVETARDAITSFDQEGRIISWNSAAEEMFGYTKGLAIGSPFFELLMSEPYLSVLKEQIQRVGPRPKKSLSERHVETEGKRRDGSLFPIEVSAWLRDLPTGRVTSCIIRDVTERTRAAEERRMREEMMRAILAASPIGIVLTQDRRIKWANDSWVRMFGFATEDEYLDQPTSIMHHSQESYDRIRKIMYDHVGRGQVSESHAILKRKDGTLFDGSIRINLVAAYDPSKGTISAISDITEKKRAEEALAQAEERYRSMFHNMPAGVAVYETADAGKTFLFTDFNVTAEAVSKVKREEVIGKSLLECFPKMEEFGLVDALRQAWDTGLPQWIPPRYYKDERREGWRENHIYKLPSGELVAIYQDVTELMLSHAQLKESGEKYRNIFDNALEGIFQSSPEGQLITVNSAYARMFGYGTPEEMLREVTDIATQLYANPADRAEVKRRFVDPVPLTNYEIECRRKDGTHFWVAMDARAVQDESGRILYYEGMTEDITARKQAEEALRKSEALLKEAQRVAHIGHWEIDSPTGTPTWSEEIFHIFGLDPARGEPSFPAHQNLIHPDDWDLLNYSVIRGTDQGVTFDIDFRLKRPDGSVRWMNARGYPTGKREGEFFRIFGTAQDITERKLAQEGLRESEQRYRVLFNDSKDGVYVTSRDGQLLDANQAYFDLFGYERTYTSSRFSLEFAISSPT